MPSILTFIGESWDFCRKQHAIMQIGFWLLFLPSLVAGLLTDFEMRNEALIEAKPELVILLILGYIAMALVMTWGSVCVLIIGKRLLQAKSGRTRTSVKTVRAQAGPLFIPFVLTEILRGLITTLFTLLFIIPGIIYAVRTVFFPIILVAEGLAYRPALRRSAEVVRGQFWNVFITVVGLALLTLIPGQILTGIFSYMAKDAPPAIILASNVASSIVITISVVIYHLSLIQAYGYFRPTSYSN
jgi:hypothetical protein